MEVGWGNGDDDIHDDRHVSPSKPLSTKLGLGAMQRERILSWRKPTHFPSWGFLERTCTCPPTGGSIGENTAGDSISFPSPMQLNSFATDARCNPSCCVTPQFLPMHYRTPDDLALMAVSPLFLLFLSAVSMRSPCSLDVWSSLLPLGPSTWSPRVFTGFRRVLLVQSTLLQQDLCVHKIPCVQNHAVRMTRIYGGHKGKGTAFKYLNDTFKSLE